jgi:integrase
MEATESARGLGAPQVASTVATDSMHPKYGLHSLRHAAASLFIEQGFSPKRVQALMGHSSIQMTFDTHAAVYLASRPFTTAMSSEREQRAALVVWEERLRAIVA